MTGPRLNPYLDIDPSAEQPLRQSLYVASQRPDPARWAKVLELSQRLKVAPELVDRNFDTYSAAADQRRVDPAQLRAETPALAQYLESPDNAALSRHELAPLARVDRGVRTLVGARDTDPAAATAPEQAALQTGLDAAASTLGFPRLPGALARPAATAFGAGYHDLAAAAGQLALATGKLDPDQAATFIAGENRAATALRAMQPDYATAFKGTTAPHMAAVDAGAHQVIAAGMAHDHILQALRDFGSGAVQSVGGLVQLIGDAATNLRGAAYTMAEGAPSMAPMMAGAEAGGLTGSLAGPAGAAIGVGAGTFVGMAPVNVGSQINAELQKRGVDITDPVALAAAFRDPATMGAIRATALREGLTNAGINAVIAPFLGRFTAGARTAGAEGLALAPALAKDAATTAGAMAGADAGGQLAGAKGDVDQVDFGKSAKTFVDMLGFGAAHAVLGIGKRALHAGDTVTAAVEAAGHAREALQTERAVQALTEIGEAVHEAPATTSVPDKLKSLVEIASGGEQAANVYFQTDAWDAHFTAQGLSPATAAADLLGDGGRAYDEAKTTGAPLTIPLADYVSKVAPTEHYTPLLEHARMTVDGPTLGEAREYLHALPATMKALADEAVMRPAAPQTREELLTERAAVAPDAETDPDAAARLAQIDHALREHSARAVGAFVREGTLKAGRTPAEAKAHQALFESTFAALGHRLKQDPLELFNQYGLTINGPEGAVTPGADGLQQPAFHGSPHIFDKFSLDKIGTGEGAQAFGHGLYFAGKKEIAQWYRDALSKRVTVDGRVIGIGDSGDHAEMHAENVLVAAGGDIDQALRETDERIASKKYAYRREILNKARTILQDWKDRGAVKVDSGGRLYHVEIPDDETMLHWDKPLSEQPSHVREALGVPTRDIAAERALLAEARAKGVRPETLPGYADLERIMDEQGHAQRTSGEQLYRDVEARMGTAARASGHLADLGISGIKYLDSSSRDFRILSPQESTSGKWVVGPREGDRSEQRYFADEGEARAYFKEKVTHNYVVFDDRAVNILQFEQPGWDSVENTADGQSADDYLKPFKGSRGQIRIGEHVTIDLFKSADRSTFLHESGHFFWHVLEGLASDPAAPADLKADHAIAREWLGAEPGAPLTRAQQEQWARGVEAYVMEGKAPTSQLRGVFYRFKQWLTELYGHVSALHVELSPEIRGVFDRLIASQEEIAKTEQQQQAQPLFADPKALGMNDEQAARYAAAVADAHQHAEEVMTARMMRDLRKEDSAEWARLRVPLEKEIQAEVAKAPVYRALTELRASLSIDRAAATEVLGPELVRQLPKGVLSAEGGVHPDVAAEVLGFRDGRELLTQLAHAPAERAMVKLLTDERMRAEYGERATPDEVRAVAKDAVLSEKRAQVLRLELEHLASDHLPALKGMLRALMKRVPPSAEVKAEARRIIGGQKVHDLRPDLYEAAAARHATAAREALVKGDVAAAFQAKSKELLTTEVHRAAVDAKEAVQAALTDFKRVFKNDAAIAKGRDMDLVNAARAILASFGLEPVGRAPEKSASAYLEQLRAYEPDAFEALAPIIESATTAAQAGLNYKALTYDDFAALHETVESLWSISRRTKQIEIDGVKLERADVEAQLAARLTDLTPAGPKAGYERAVTKWEKTKRTLMSGRAWLRRAEHWVDAIDGENGDGHFRRTVWNPVQEGIVQYRLAKGEMIAHWLDVTKVLDGRVKDTAIPAPELGYTFRDTGELLGALLHTGNESNLSKLLRGRGWGTEDENGVLDRVRWDAFTERLRREGVLGKPEYDYVQGVWDLFERTKPDAQRAHREMFGHFFAEVTAKPFTNEFGTYAGGYYPAKADPFLVPDAQIRGEKQALLESGNSFMFPSTGRGFTKSRVEAYAKPLLMDGNVGGAIDAVLRFTHIEPRVKDVARMMISRDLRPVIDGFDPTVAGDLLVPWLQRAATQRVDIPGNFKRGDAFFRAIRRRSGLQIMAGSVITALQQIGHAPAALVKVDANHFAGALWRYVRSPKATAADIVEKSAYMRTRESVASQEMLSTINRIMDKPSTFENIRNFSQEHGYFLTHGVQSVIDVVTWSGAYDQAITRGLTEPEAVRAADSIVRETQGSFEPESISRFEANTPFVKTLAQFYGFFNTKANMLGTEFEKPMRDLGLRKGAGRLLYVYTLGFMIPSVMAGIVRQQASGRPFDQDDDGPWDDALKLFFGSQLHMATGMLPVVGALANEGIDHLSGQSGQDNLFSSAAWKALESVAKTPGDVYHAIRDGELKHGEINDVLTALGMLTGTPARALGRPLGYLNDVSTGRANPSGPYDVGRGLLTGQPGAP